MRRRRERKVFIGLDDFRKCAAFLGNVTWMMAEM
jgi:hypothetical protein